MKHVFNQNYTEQWVKHATCMQNHLKPIPVMMLTLWSLMARQAVITTWAPSQYKTIFPRYEDSHVNRAANQYGTSVFCTDFTCKIREYEFGLQNTEIELCQFCHLKYCCQNKAYLFWVAIQSSIVAFYALKPSITSLITKTFNLLSSTCGSSLCSCQLPVPVVPKESTRVSTGSGWVPPE